MGRREERELKRQINKDIAEFLKIQNHYFPYLIRDIREVLDKRHQSYTTYEIEVILYVSILKNICSIVSMQEMSYQFNEDECVKNIYKILGLEEKEFLPHYVTINECLSKLEPEELEKVRKKMIYNLIRKKSFDDGKFLGLHWLVIVDATQLFCFKKRHCEHCLTKTFNRGTEDEYSLYYHQVLEARIVFSDEIVLSIATEFIENEGVELSKQDCELNAFKRLSASLKKMFPRLPICLMGDSLYACEPVFNICKKYNWEYLIRYKDGSIPTLAEDYRGIVNAGDGEETVIEIDITHKRKPDEKEAHTMIWVNDLYYNGHTVAVFELEIEKKGKETVKVFKWLSSIRVTKRKAREFADTGRKRWLIENEGFNIQKNHRYMITHANSLDYNAMKNHYLITQLADMLLQLYEYGIKGLKLLRRTIKTISERLLESLKSPLTNEDLQYERFRVTKAPI